MIQHELILDGHKSLDTNPCPEPGQLVQRKMQNTWRKAAPHCDSTSFHQSTHLLSAIKIREFSSSWLQPRTRDKSQFCQSWKTTSSVTRGLEVMPAGSDGRWEGAQGHHVPSGGDSDPVPR